MSWKNFLSNRSFREKKKLKQKNVFHKNQCKINQSGRCGLTVAFAHYRRSRLSPSQGPEATSEETIIAAEDFYFRLSIRAMFNFNFFLCLQSLRTRSNEIYNNCTFIWYTFFLFPERFRGTTRRIFSFLLRRVVRISQFN